MRAAHQLDVNGESTTLRRIEATLRTMVFKRPAPHVNARSVRHSAHSTQGAVLGPLTDWWQDPHFMGLGVVWVYVTDILMSVASNYIIPKLPKVWLDVRARISSQEVRA